jgi:predicted ATPase
LDAKVLAEPAIVGRERELEDLDRHLTLALEGKGNTVLIAGEAGSGKTRLTNEFLAAVKEKDVAVLSGYCQSYVAVPYFPFIEAFDAYFSAKKQEEESTASSAHEAGKSPEGKTQFEDEGLDVEAWLKGTTQAEKTWRGGSLSPENWRDMTFAAVTKALLSISKQKPTVLFLDDIHWADSASLALFHYVSRAVRSSRVLVLATFRGEELNPDEEGHPHRLAETLRLMRREDLCTEIKLHNLSQTYVSKVAENMIGGTLHPEFITKLAVESQGNPLFIVESLRMLTERGSLHKENDLWRLSSEELVIPDKFKDIILGRLSVLKFSQRSVLDAASVIGDRFDAELLGTVLGQNKLEILQTLSMIAQSTSLVRVEEGFFRFDHAKSRQVIYEEIPVPLKRGYHAQVAERLEIKSGPLPFSDIAYHYAQAENKQKAVEYALKAGKEALARFSNAEAIKHFTYVLQTVPDAPENAETKRTALEKLGDAYYANCMYAKALELFERLQNG